MSALGKELKRLRTNAGLTQTQVAAILEVNRSTYTYYETGHTVPRISSLNKLCKLYKVPMDPFIQCLIEDGN